MRGFRCGKSKAPISVISWADSRDIVDDLNARYGRPKPGAGVRLKEVLEGGAHADPAAEGDPDGSG